MEKLIRFTGLLFLSVLLFIILYSILPAIVWVFGGSFLEVAQHPAYACLIGITIIIIVGAIMSECFDQDFYSR